MRKKEDVRFPVREAFLDVSVKIYEKAKYIYQQRIIYLSRERKIPLSLENYLVIYLISFKVPQSINQIVNMSPIKSLKLIYLFI
jgi:hypothetical protein